jgi:colanic acid/amylovoran biosynthesis protein
MSIYSNRNVLLAESSAKNIVICNVYGHANAGDAMLLDALLDLISQHLPNARIQGIAFDVASESQWVPQVSWFDRLGNYRGSRSGRVKQALWLAVLAVMASSSRFIFLKNLLPKGQADAITALQSADLALSCPGGYLEDSNSAYILNLLQVIIAKRCSKTVVLAPQSIGPISSGFGRWLVAKALLCSDRIFVREQSSLAFVRSTLGERYWEREKSKVELVGDLAFWFDRRTKGNVDSEFALLGVDPSRPIVGITIVDWPFTHADNPKVRRQQYKEALQDLVRHIQSTTDSQIVVFNQVATDLNFAREVAGDLPGVFIDAQERDCSVFSVMIARCAVFVGTRFHSCIFALLGSVPTAAIAYLPKTSGIMQDLGLGEFYIDINEITPDSLISMFTKVSSSRAELPSRIRDCVDRYKEESDGFIDFLAAGGNQTVTSWAGRNL